MQVELCKMPALTITLTLNFPEYFHGGLGSSYSKTGGDIVAFVSGLLLGNDQSVRNWFSIFTRIRPKVCFEIIFSFTSSLIIQNNRFY